MVIGVEDDTGAVYRIVRTSGLYETVRLFESARELGFDISGRSHDGWPTSSPSAAPHSRFEPVKPKTRLEAWRYFQGPGLAVRPSKLHDTSMTSSPATSKRTGGITGAQKSARHSAGLKSGSTQGVKMKTNRRRPIVGLGAVAILNSACRLAV